MNILKHRPLFCACFIYIACAFGAYLILPQAKTVLLCVSCALFLGCAACLLCKRLPRKMLLYAAAFALSALLALGGSLIAFDTVMQKYDKLAEQQTCSVEATVLARQGSDEISIYRVRVHRIDGKAQRFDATMVCAFPSYLQVGDTFLAQADPRSLQETANVYYDVNAALASGLRLQLFCEDEAAITEAHQNERFILSVRLAKLNDTLCRKLISVCGASSGGLVCALLLGNKSFLDATLVRDFARAGASHLLALSGLHVSILMGAVGFLLAKLRLHRKLRAVLLVSVALAYLLLTGVSVSATRAVVMMCILQLSYLLAADNDTLTTLGLVGAGILLLDPYSVCDNGFILSFLATFGIVVLVPPLHTYLRERTNAACQPYQKHKKRLLGIAVAILETLLIGVIACFAVFVPSCFLIGNMSVFSPLTTLLLSPVIAALLVLGGVTLLVCPIPPLANLFATLIRLLYAVSMPYIQAASGVDGALIPLTHDAVRVLAILLCGAMLTMMLLPLRKKLLLALPPVLLCISLCIFFPIQARLDKNVLRAAYTHPSSISEATLCTEGYRAYICDLSSGTGSAMYTSAYAAAQMHATEIGALLLTDYHTTQSAMLHALLSSYKTDALYLPLTRDSEELSLQHRLEEIASAHGVKVVLYQYGEAVAWLDGTTITVHRTDLSRSEQPALIITLQKGDATLCLCSPAAQHTALQAQFTQALATADAVVCTERGPKPRLTYSLAAAADADVIFATKELAAFCDPGSLVGARSMKVCPEIAYFTLATKQEK